MPQSLAKHNHGEVSVGMVRPSATLLLILQDALAVPRLVRHGIFAQRAEPPKHTLAQTKPMTQPIWVTLSHIARLPKSSADMLRAASENIANATKPLATLRKMVPITLRVTSRVISFWIRRIMD